MPTDVVCISKIILALSIATTSGCVKHRRKATAIPLFLLLYAILKREREKKVSLILHPPTASFELMKLTKKERREEESSSSRAERRARAVFSIFHSLGSCQNYAATR